MPEHSGYVLEALREHGDFTLYRGRRDGDASRVLVVALAAEEPSPQSLRQLQHEYSLAAELDPTWAAVPLEVTRRDGSTMLVLQDPGGDPLDQILDLIEGKPLELTRALRIATGLATALGRVHSRGLIHKDIKPANVLVDDAGHVWLTGFGIASRLPQEYQAPAPPEVIAGTLPYMAPEQTGRMNRSIDARSDLYSLGVTLYQMLTGSLPFAAADPLEWVHCHVARQPTPPSDRATVPEPLSSLTMKLLAKNAEERYQTASGVEADLHRCLEEWQSNGRLDPFPLGRHDTSDRLLIPEKLYGREREIERMLAAFDRVVAHGARELVLVSGYSGVGKSSVVNELHKVLVPPRGLFAAGKFDQYKRDIPYTTLAQAFQTLVRQILVKSEAELGQWRDTLLQAVGPNGQLIVSLIPEVEFIIGKQPSVQDLPARDAQNRFKMVFRRFLDAFARPEHPLALFLDDLQWLDAATLELLEYLICDPEVRHVLLVGAYRDNEVTSSHPLLRTLDAIRKAGANLDEIVLAPLRVDDVGRLVADAVHGERNATFPLAHVVHEKTGGNPFFVIQFLTALTEEGLLAFDRYAAGWVWDLARIHAKGYTDNVVDLMVEKLSRLPTSTRKALQQLACLGNSANFAPLSIAHEDSQEELRRDLQDALATGLVLRSEGSYRFLHDRVQEAAYSLIPEAQRAEAHLRIGRLLVAHTQPEKREEAIFEIVNQLNRGAALITSRDEREPLAEFNLMAGKRAKASTAYLSALTYLAAGAGLLADDCWERRHDLAFALELTRAECEYLTSQFGPAEERLGALSERAASLGERAAVASVRVDLYVTLGQPDRASATCLDYLRHLGIDWSIHPTDEDVGREYDRIWSQLGTRAIKELIDLPLMSDPISLATLEVLTKAIPPAWFTDTNLGYLVTCRAANLSLERGNSDSSCTAYEHLGIIAGPRFGNYQAGAQFGRLGYELVEKRGLTRFQSRTYMLFGNVIMPWTTHIRAGRDLVRRAFDVANSAGDLTFAAFSCKNLITNLLAAGDPLSDVQREAEHGLEFAKKIRFGFAIDTITTQLALIRTLRGLTQTFGCFDDDGFEEVEFEHHLASSPALVLPEFWYWTRKLQARLLAGDNAGAVDAALRAHRLLWTSPSWFETAECIFYGALAHGACCDSASPDSRRQHVEALAAHLSQLEVWAEHCPANFSDRVALAGAESARLETRDLEAMRLYERAIRLAREHGFVQNEGLAHELAARFYLTRGLETIGQASLRSARNCYDRWGAIGKVKQLDARYPHLHEERGPTSLTGTIGTPVGELDVKTVLKASHALSSEIVLPRLIETLMRIAVEHAGAERGLLILLRGGEPRIAAEATTGDGRAQVSVRDEAIAPSHLPQSALHYVIRTHERVILDDASMRNLYSEDEYVRRVRPRSVICLPIVKQSKLVGALYLENGLTPFAFSPDRVFVLEMLASQAAISLENANLYADLQLSEAALRASEFNARMIVDCIPGLAARVSPAGEVEVVNRPLLEYFGKDLEEVRNWATTDAIYPDDLPLAIQTFNNSLPAGQPFDVEHRLRRFDGVYRWFQSRGLPLRDPEGRILHWYVLLTDIEERKQAEDQLRRSEAFLAEGQHLAKMGSFSWRVAQNEITWSEQLYRIFDFERQLPVTLELIGSRVHPDDVPTMFDMVEKARRGVGDFEYEHRLLMPDQSVKYVHMIAHGFRDKDGLMEYVGAAQDITDRRLSEQALGKLRSELAHVARITSLGALTASIAHEVNQPLSGIITNAGTCLRMLSADPPNVEGALETARRTIRDGNRATDVVQRLRTLYTKKDISFEPMDLTEATKDVISLCLIDLQRNRVILRPELAEDLPPIAGDRMQLQQVILNLLRNASDAMSTVEDRPRELVIRTERDDEDRVRLSVQDAGVGIDAQTRDRLFEAFYTTKRDGMGMGLSVSRSIIDAHGGRLRATANEGPGATFSFVLPCHHADASSTQPGCGGGTE